MSTWILLILTAVIALLVGATVGGRNARRRAARATPDRGPGASREEMQRTYRDVGSGWYASAPGAPSRSAPAMSRRNYPPASRSAGDAPGAQAALDISGRGSARVPLRRTPTLDMAPSLNKDTAELRISTAAGDTVHALPDEEGFIIGPRDADILVPALPTRLLLGRSGYVWTVQAAGPVDLDVALDGVPLTSVPMPWTSERRLTAGKLTLMLDNAPAARPSFREPAAYVDPAYALTCAARANGYGLVIGRSDSRDASTLVAAALAALDPRMLDPARTAALAALNVTLAVRDARGHRSDDFGAGPPQVAVLAIDANGELRAAANFDVLVWAVTEHTRMPLSSHVPGGITPLEAVPLDLHAATELGERPMLLLTVGASRASLGQYLVDCTPRTTSPEKLVANAAGKSQVPMAAAAVVDKPDVLRSGIPRVRTREGPYPEALWYNGQSLGLSRAPRRAEATRYQLSTRRKAGWPGCNAHSLRVAAVCRRDLPAGA